MNKLNDDVLQILIVLAFAFVIFIASILFNNSPSPQATPNTPSNTTSETTEEPAESTAPLTFNGYDCTDDCSGHEAGYAWAEDNDVCDEYYEDGNSESFNEGVRSYAENNCN